MAAALCRSKLARFNGNDQFRGVLWGMTMDSISVLLADDNVIIREGVRAMLARRGGPRGRRIG